MAGIQTFRERYPQYGHISDTDIAEAVLKKDYADADRDQFMSAFLGTPEPMAEVEPEPFQEPEETPDNLGIGRGESFEVPDVEQESLSITHEGAKYEINREGYDSDEAATDAFLSGNNPPRSVTETDKWSEDLALQPDQQEEKSERSYTQQYNDETVRQGKQRVNEDGTTTTVLSKTGELDGKWYNVPGFDRDTGKDYESDDAAIDAAREDILAGKVTAYDTGEEAINAATEEHKELEEPEAAPTDLSDFGVTDEQLNAPELEDDGKPGWWLGRAAAFVGKQANRAAGGLVGLVEADPKILQALGPKGKMLAGIRSEAGNEETISYLREKGDELMKIAEESTPEGFAGKAFTDMVDGAVNMATSITVGQLTGSSALGLSQMGVEVFLETFDRTKREGRDSVDSFYQATRSTFYEVGPEKLFGFFDKMGGAGFKDWAMQAFREAGSEALTSIMEQSDEVWMQGKEWEGWTTAFKRAAYDAFIGWGMGGMLSTPMLFRDKADPSLPEAPPTDDRPPDSGDMELLDLEMGGPTEGLPTLEDADPREVIRRKPHSELMENPVYRRFYDASDLGELSGSHEERAAEAKAAYIRKAEQIKKWKPIVEEVAEKQEAAAEAVEPVGEAAAVKEREAFEDDKAVEPDLPDGFDPSEMVYTNIDGEEVGYSLEEAAKLVERFDKNEETSPISREERDQIDVQLDEYRKRYDEEESVDSPRSEAREEREIVIPKDEVWGSTVEEVDPKTLTLNPELMQYKSGTDAKGRNKQLEGITTFDASKAGIILAWEDVTGKRIVADGHQRVNLLNELQAQGRQKGTKILTRVYRESEGFSAEDVRTIAAEINIAQGTGTAMDAAKVLRDYSETEVADLMTRMPVSSSLVRDALGLSKLGEEAFQVVVNELIEPRFGSMVGNAFEEAEQTAAMQILIKAKPSNFNEAYAMIADIQAGGFIESEQGGLFGESVMESLIKERAAILSAAESKLRKNVTVFNALTKEEKRIEGAGNVLDTEANKAIAKQAGSIIARALRTINTNPELNNELNKIATQYRNGTTTKVQAANLFVEAATAYTERSGGKLVDKPGVEGAGKDAEAKEAKGQIAEEKRTVADVTVEAEQISETGEKEMVSEPADKALGRLDKRISVLESVLKCVRA